MPKRNARPVREKNKITKKGYVLGFARKRRFPGLSDLEHKREYLRLTKKTPVRDHPDRRERVGEDPNEQRATHKIQGSILERIVYRRLEILLGPEGASWVSQKGLGGARMFKGGYVLDFEIFWPKRIDIEVQGAFWHGPSVSWRDAGRAFAVLADGFEYEEILEWQIWMGDEYLDFCLQQILGI